MTFGQGAPHKGARILQIVRRWMGKNGGINKQKDNEENKIDYGDQSFRWHCLQHLSNTQTLHPVGSIISDARVERTILRI